MISVIVLTKNDENTIVDCLKSLSWSDEIIIIDDYSEDKTLDLIKSLDNKKIKLFMHHLDQDFSYQRNFAMSKSTGDWIMFVDADEKVSDSLSLEIVSTIYSAPTTFNGFYIKRTDFLWGKKLMHGETGNISFVRLGRRGLGEWKGKVHEGWRINGKIGKLKNPIYHYPHPDITSLLKEINFYTDIRTQELYEKRIHVYWYSIIAYPLFKFLNNYFLKLGFLDGISGLVFSIVMSFHSFLVRGKLWVLYDQKKRDR